MAKRLQPKAKSGQVIPPTITANVLDLEMENQTAFAPCTRTTRRYCLLPRSAYSFSEITVPSPSSKIPTLELRANVTMTPTLFKALAQAVTQTLAAYEKQFGTIQWPKKISKDETPIATGDLYAIPHTVPRSVVGHIIDAVEGHPEMVGREHDVRRAIEDPDIIRPSTRTGKALASSALLLRILFALLCTTPINPHQNR